METEAFTTFCDKELPCTSFASFQDMRKSGRLCDLTIRAKDCTLRAHHVIVAAGIPFFGSRLTGNGVKTEQKEFDVGELDPGALGSLIDFAYSGAVNISDENVHSLLLASQFLQLDQVLEACVDFISESLSVSNVVQAFTLAYNLDIVKLSARTKRYIMANFEKLSKAADFVNLPHLCLKEIISTDNLNVSDEKLVFEAVVTWVKSSLSERRILLPELMSEVRMVYLPTDYLLKEVACDDLVRKSKGCRELVEKVKTYHLLPQGESASLNLKVAPRKFINRNDDMYTFCFYASGFSLCYRDFLKDKWCELPFNNLLAVWHVVAVKGKIYTFSLTGIRSFDVKTRKWKILKAQYEHFQGTTVLAYGNTIYLFSSLRDEFMDRIFCFDTEKTAWLKERRMATPRRYTAVASLMGSVYVTGGVMSLGVLNTVEKYNPLSDGWNEVAPMLTPRKNHACTGMDAKIYVCGNESSVLEDRSSQYSAEVYDPLTDQWNFISSMNVGRHSFSLVACNSKIYAIGGQISVKNTECVEIYDSENDQWEFGFRVPVGFRHVVVIPRARF